MDLETQLARMTDDEILNLAHEFGDLCTAYVMHRKAPVRLGAQRAPFDFAKFIENARLVYNFIAPIISAFTKVTLPVIPHDPAPASPK